MDIKLDETTGDVVFVNGESTVTSIGSEDLAQRLSIRLGTFKGEWFMDDQLGIDYFGSVLGKGRSKSAIDALFQSEIMKETDVLQITKFDSVKDNDNYDLSFTARTENGAVVSIPTITIAL